MRAAFIFSAYERYYIKLIFKAGCFMLIIFVLSVSPLEHYNITTVL